MPRLRNRDGHQNGGQETGWSRSCGPDFISVLITKSIFSKTGGKGEKGVGGEGPEELTHILHLAADTCSPSHEFLACALQKPRLVPRRCLGSNSLAVADPGRATSAALSANLLLPQSWGSGQVKDCREGQCDCRVAAMALAVALTTATGSLAAGSTAGMSLGTLCMGGMLGPSRVSRIPSTTLW